MVVQPFCVSRWCVVFRAIKKGCAEGPVSYLWKSCPSSRYGGMVVGCYGGEMGLGAATKAGWLAF